MATIVYVDGVFDMIHSGHINFLKKSKEFGDILIVGVVTDEDAASYKRKPIIPYENRVEILKELKIVDDVIEAPLIITKRFIEENFIDIVVHGDDDEQVEFFKVPREMGIMRYVEYTPGISTSYIISKIREREEKDLDKKDLNEIKNDSNI